MSKIYRIKTTPGIDQNLTVNINQDFEEIELLSLKIRQEDVYPIGCANYGVIAGRVFVNGGYGLPKAKVSVFIPLRPEDEDNPVLTSYYPYRTLEDVNEDGYKYNLLPYVASYSGHSPTGTFPTREDVLKDPVASELFEKYYKYTVTTNESGDYMIYGVPLGTHTIVLNVDLSDIGEFSMTPQDLIRIGRGTENQFNGSFFRSSNNFNELPQIVYETKIVQVNAFWGQDDTCQVGITRADFDLSSGQNNITIQPTAVFMGSIFSSETTKKVKRRCKVKSKLGQLCQLTTGPGQIIAIRQTIDIDDDGYPVLEKYDLPQNGKLIDADGTWVIEVPMNLDYVYTNENGERVLSDDPKLGIPTNGKYRFKIKWQQPAGLTEENRRGYFLVPNIKEHGWTNSGDPLLQDTETFTIQTNDPVINIVGQSGYVYRVKSKTNVTDFVVELDGNPYVGNKNDILLNSNDIISITPTYEDDEATSTWVFEKIPLVKYRLERSYAFSLSWYDYNDPQEAIDCIDTFYFMKYNKVYTVSQLLDRYTSRRFTWNTLQIKNINTDDCDESTNKLPVNDVQYRFVPIFILLSFFLTLMKFLLRAIIIPMHLLAFLWPVIFLIMQLVWVIQMLIHGICKALNKIRGWLGKAKKECGEKPKRTKYADNWFRNVKLPLLLYTEDGCERCDCKDSEIDLSGNETADGLQQNATDARTGTINSSPLADFNSADAYTVGDFQQDFPYLWEGPNTTTIYEDTPNDANGPEYLDVLFTNSLTIAERLNTFNLKDKYFDTTTINGGVGRNQVKRTVTGNGNIYHYDNTMVLVVDGSELSNFISGQLISFSDPTLSTDPNLTGATVNTGGTNSITGTPISNGAQWTVNYASPSNPTVSNSVTYTINYSGESKDYLTFPTDMEYFQVLTGLTLGTFSALTENHTNINSNFLNRSNKTDFLNRYLNNQMRVYDIVGDYLGSNVQNPCKDALWRSIGLAPNPGFDASSSSNIQTPLFYYDGAQSLGIIILQRGVDPHSPKVQQEIDLSRIFGWANYGQAGLTITGEFNLNIPIQSSSSSLKLPRHNQFTTNNATDFGSSIFFQGTFDVQGTFSSYTSNLLRYYSRLGENGNSTTASVPSSNYLTKVQTDSNAVASTTSCGCDTFYNLKLGWWFTQGNNSQYGYSVGEYVEGGSYADLGMSNSISTFCGESVPNEVSAYASYISNIYPSSTTVQMVNPSKLVMRTDRLPSSTQIPSGDTTGNGILLMHQNPSFTIYLLDESGSAQALGSAPEVYTFTEIETEDIPSQYMNVIESLSDCSKAVPLECYVVNPDNTVSIKPCDESNGTCCGKNYNTGGFRSWFNYGFGCYNLVSFPIISIVKDFNLIIEFIQRLKLNMALCFDVFSHTFGNAWINGTLYAFPFQMNTFFDTQNKPNYNYCKELMYFHDPTNNFYYRSSPYNDNNNKFIGRDANERANDNGNEKQLGFPTTMMDLGPKVPYLQEIVFSDDYDGYIVDKLDSTSFKNVSDILNVMILSRFVNENFLSLFLPGLGSGSDPSVAGFFRNKRWNPSGNILFPGTIDGDYSQMASVNSEFGIAEFSPEGYDINTSFKVMRDNSNYAYFEIFFSGNNQDRDYITPRRKIWNENASTAPLPSDFGYISTFSQEVPFYEWEFKTTNSGTIFGNQNNNWDTNESGFFKYKYQSIDRISPASHSVIVGSSNSKYWKGFIYNVDSNGNATDSIPSGFQDKRQVNNPFFFYFGLKKGASAYDKFKTKYINETDL
jgi:hypothetical protein